MESDAYRRLLAQREAARGGHAIPPQRTPKNLPQPKPPQREGQREQRPNQAMIAEIPPAIRNQSAEGQKRERSRPKFSSTNGNLAASLALGAANLLGFAAVSQKHHSSRSYEFSTTETVGSRPVEVHGFERAPFGAPTNEEVTAVERSIFPMQYHIPIQLVRVANAPRAMPPEYGIVGNEDAHCDVGHREIVVGPQVVMMLHQQTGEWIYNNLLLHEDGHAFNWNNAPNLTSEQRDLYRRTFTRHLQDGTPRIRSSYVDAIRNADPNQELEFKAIEYQAELVQSILSIPFPEYRTGTWDEAVAQKIHEIHQIPLEHARYEVRLFRWMIELTFPGRSPETMHRDVQGSIQRVVEQGSHRINTTVLHQQLSPELQAITDQAFVLPHSESWLRQYTEGTISQASSRRHPSPRQELLQQQAARIGQIYQEIDRRSEHPSQVRDLFQRADLLGRFFHRNHVAPQAVARFQSIYMNLSRHDRQVVQHYLPTYGQILQFKPSLYHVPAAVDQAAHAHAI